MMHLKTHSLGDGTPKIAVAFDDSCKVDEIQAIEHLDIAEIKVDLFKEISVEIVIKTLQKFSQLGLITILTFRSKLEGGDWTGDDATRVKIFAECYQYADIVDIESSSISASAAFVQLANSVAKSDTKLLISYHNFDKTPSLEVLNYDIVHKSLIQKADIIKIACYVTSNTDVSVLTQVLTGNPEVNLVVIGMGERGLETRLNFPKYGSLFTFAYAGVITAPGQMHIDNMVEQLQNLYPEYLV